MARGLYGQNEGNETRSAVACMEERIADNALVEGQYVSRLRNVASRKDWRRFQDIVDGLLSDGFSRGRVNSMTTSALAGLRL